MKGDEQMQEIKINYHYLDKCDFHCKHCFDRINKTELDRDKVITTFENLTRVTKAINLVGGEVFTEIDLLIKLLKIGVRERVNMSLVTNGNILLRLIKENNPKVDEVIKHLRIIGISVDSFIGESNIQSGRSDSQTYILDIGLLQELKYKCDIFGVKLKVNTVVSKINLNEDMKHNIKLINPDIWKVIQVFSNNPDTKITDEEFADFGEKHLDLNPVLEYSKNLRKAYFMVNANGDLFYDGEIRPINVNLLMEEERSYLDVLCDKMRDNKIDSTYYFSRYNNQNRKLNFSKKKYSKFRKRIFSDGNILFLDVESITPRPFEKKLYGMTNTQLHFLYCGLITDDTMEIKAMITDHIDYNKKFVSQIDKTKNNSQDIKNFYMGFLRNIIKHKVTRIVVSALETETNFFQDCIYYLDKLNRKDYETLQHLFNNLVDIQTVKREEIINMDINSSSSRSILAELNTIRKDLFPYTRKSDKDGRTSLKVSESLVSIYFRNKTDNAKEIIGDITQHCYR